MKIVSAILQSEGLILLCLRGKTKHSPEQWSLPVGHVEVGENNIDALRRELFEEIAVQLIDCELFTTLFDNSLNVENNIYHILEWRGVIKNLEPDLCTQIDWFSKDNLPSPLTKPTATVLKGL